MSVPPLEMKALLCAASPGGLNWSCSHESSTTQRVPQCTLCCPPVTSVRVTVRLLPHTAPPIHLPATTSESTTSTEYVGSTWVAVDSTRGTRDDSIRTSAACTTIAGQTPVASTAESTTVSVRVQGPA